MIETDVLFAHVKEDGRLKRDAETLFAAIDSGKMGKVYASRECIHELHYLLKRAGFPPGEALNKIGALTRIRNLEWPPTTTDATYDQIPTIRRMDPRELAEHIRGKA